MQKDFMAMAQGQQSPAASPQQAPEGAEELNAKSVFEEVGLPTEDTPEAGKKRLMMVLEELGIMEGLRPDQLQQLTKLVDEYVAIAQKGDLAALEKHPISQLLNQAQQEFQQSMQPQPTGGPVPQQGAVPQDFASMMPGGGMGGR
jgi:acyl-CoA synthetase (NDP forming)